ncbi:uncharacterized protein LOC129966717 [Argiope bruennichi]|uniref:uncharacterized protein LOC129966717 n=1 Tax=Argiope bruennichi TaxID=94029 RepID=UPI002494339C|nr:uncharacterized protein LOC129966717 [Argiope bruennichi]XP_055937232.1 uncharacterized protein LOC129966717 [Argiope bruennichi]
MTPFSAEGCDFGKELETSVSVCGKESISLLQNDQIFITQLNQLHKLILLPVLRTRIPNSENIIQDLHKIILSHQSIYSGIISGECSLISAGKELSSHLHKWAMYCKMIHMEINELKKICEFKENEFTTSDFFESPTSLISKFEEIFQNLCDAVPENEDYKDILESIQYTFDDVIFKASLPNNALRLLQIQRLLIDRQPRILNPSRILLKEGCLYKVNYKSNKTKKLAFILFDDALLICKIQNKSFEWHVKDSLKCCALLPLHACSVNFASGTPSVKGNLFKVKCWNISYLLMSKVPGDAQSWIQALQSAIRRYKGSFKETTPYVVIKKNRKKDSGLFSNCLSWFT